MKQEGRSKDYRERQQRALCFLPAEVVALWRLGGLHRVHCWVYEKGRRFTLVSSAGFDKRSGTFVDLQVLARGTLPKGVSGRDLACAMGLWSHPVGPNNEAVLDYPVGTTPADLEPTFLVVHQ